MEYKLLNFTICQIFIVIGMLVLFAKCQEQKMPSAENVTLFDRSFEKVLSRRKRFLVWRPGSNILLTGSLVKPLAFTRPKGHNLILEWDIFYPLPDSWRKPKKPTPPPPPPPPPTKSPPEIVEYDDHHSHHSGEIWMPSSGWSSDTDVIKTLSEAEADSAEKRRWDGYQVNKSNLRRNGWNRNDLKSPLVPYRATQYQNPLLYNQPWQQLSQANQFSRNKIDNFNQRNYQFDRQTSPSEKNFMSMTRQQQMKFVPKGRSLELHDDTKATQLTPAEESTDDNWEHHYAHRDRRDLYERIEKALPSALTSFDIKSCLLRTICESQHFLHPPGYSLLQDMLRVVFTIPIKEDMGDDYGIAMQANHQDCESVYSVKCPMSILAFLLQSKK